MTTKSIVLVTGANKGIGLAAAQQLAERGHTVLVGARDRARGEAAMKQLKSSGADVHLLEIDVADEGSVLAATRQVAKQFGRLDVLVNNAATHHEIGNSVRPSEVDVKTLNDTYATNVAGPLLTMKHFRELLRSSKSPQIINVSSTAASLTSVSDPSHPLAGINTAAYTSSKAALNALTVGFAKEYAADGIAVNAVCPGWTRTDMGGDAPRLPSQGATIIVELAMMASPPTGKFLDENGVVPW